MIREQQLNIASKMYQCRDQQVFLSGEEKFKETVSEYKPLFDKVMKKEQCNEVKALITLLNRAKGHAEEGMLMHVLTAVACELTEPKYTKA